MSGTTSSTDSDLPTIKRKISVRTSSNDPSSKGALSRNKSGTGKSSGSRMLDPMTILWGDPFDPAKVLQIPSGPNPNGERYLPPWCRPQPPPPQFSGSPCFPPPFPPIYQPNSQQIMHAPTFPPPGMMSKGGKRAQSCCNNCYFYPPPDNNCAPSPFPFSAIMKSMPPFRSKTNASCSSSCENLF